MIITPPTPVPSCSENITTMEFADMYFVKFDVLGKCLNDIWSKCLFL